ncbi:hypothetical protein Taro_002649 [Colocasia esculenta]|uniref:Uncharacterized protein n=1 Tax=Colocasia esculenta TaxID=4460 RepID=A0A843TJS6_COLES|nr:hypothetical protein [Colocasia esculenta]
MGPNTQNYEECNDNEWMKSLYESRLKWAPVFLKDTFFAAVFPHSPLLFFPSLLLKPAISELPHPSQETRRRPSSLAEHPATTPPSSIQSPLPSPSPMSGSITYNGHRLNEFVPQSTEAYVSQQDSHSLAPIDMLLELARREKIAGIKPDGVLDLFMKADGELASNDGDGNDHETHLADD